MIYSENILLCIAIPLLTTVFFIRGDARRFIVSFILGMVVCLLSAYITGYVGVLNGMGEEWNAIYVSPVVEELMKMLPLLIYLVLYIPRHGQLLPVAIALAAGFATFENCCYILAAGSGSLSYILIRGMAVGIMHIVSILALCLGLIVVQRIRSMPIPGFLGALSFSMVFHGLYNLLVSEPGLSSYIAYVLPVITAVILYFPYRRMRYFVGTEEAEERMDQEQ